MIKQVISPQDSKTLKIEFMIGNTCNYSCWYCFPGSHEGEYRWTNNLDLVIKNLFHLLDHYKAFGKTKFEMHIVGGEPTLWPKLGEFVKLLKENYNVWISIGTNGSRTLNWWRQYSKYFDEVLISVHHEKADIEHIKSVGDIIYKENKEITAMVLMDPFEWDRCVDIVEKLKESKYKWFINTLEIMHETISYTSEQVEFINNPVKRYPTVSRLIKKIMKSKTAGKPKVVFENDKVEKINHNWIGLNKLTNFKGWQCNIGVDSIYIDKDGRITGSCRTVLFENYNLYDLNFVDKFKPDIKPKICDQTFCGSQPEQILNKIKL